VSHSILDSSIGWDLFRTYRVPYFRINSSPYRKEGGVPNTVLWRLASQRPNQPSPVSFVAATCNYKNN
jgi:hypothetical protein